MSDTLESLANSFGFTERLALLRPYVLPCVGFSLQPHPDCGVGSSRLGGGPDLPASFEWPMNKNRPLDFLMQVNLRDIASLSSVQALPREGVLSFFYDLREQPWGYDPKDLGGYAVRLFPESLPLQRLPAPDGDVALSEAALQFWPAETLPAFGSRAAERLTAELTDELGSGPDWDALDGLSAAIFRAQAPTPDGPSHRLGGHSSNVQGDMQLEAQLVMHGLYCGDPSGYRDPRAEELERTCDVWSLLLQLDSDEDAGLMWGDLGMLYYWARSHDIERHDFSKTWMTLQCG